MTTDYEIIDGIGNAVRIRQDGDRYLVEFAALDGPTGAVLDDTWGPSDEGPGSRRSIFRSLGLAQGYVSLVSAEGECHNDVVRAYLDSVGAGE